MSLRLVGTSLALVWLLAIATGCDDEDLSPRITTGTPKAGNPLSTDRTPDTGIPEVDALIRAVHTHDLDALDGMVRFEAVECISEPRGIGAPPLCSSIGVPNGSIIEILPLSVLHAEYIVKSDASTTFQEWLQRYGLTFYGVLKPNQPSLTFRPGSAGAVPAYEVVFRGLRMSQPGVADFDFGFYLDEGAIVAVRKYVVGIVDVPAPGDPAWIVPPRP